MAASDKISSFLKMSVIEYTRFFQLIKYLAYRKTILVWPIILILLFIFVQIILIGISNAMSVFSTIDDFLLQKLTIIWFLYSEIYLDLVAIVILLYMFPTLYMFIFNKIVNYSILLFLRIEFFGTIALLSFMLFCAILIEIILLIYFPLVLSSAEALIVGLVFYFSVAAILCIVVLLIRYNLGKGPFRKSLTGLWASLQID